MFRKLLFLFSIIFFISQPLKADLIDDLQQHKEDLQAIEKAVQESTKREETIKLAQDEARLAKIVTAYENAIAFDREETETKTATRNINSNQTLFIDLQDMNASDKQKKVVSVGTKWINNSKYVFGGGRNQLDVMTGRFDCSSFVYWAFDQVGITLGNMTSVTTDTLKSMGSGVTMDNIQIGDLVFFNTYKIDGHVGIYAGNGRFIGAQSSTGVSYADMTSGYWKEKFNGRIIRVF
ncbi:C40 family peptidase [Gracilibacillus caseinilyticus]|uniref:C40 family peptidase n=1 Tax=Gracilibacillus caseinilyticus TaxID=2932256 RepID=A0ABY4ETN0_9BACI|nr:C40 family peptidase [Gracilibacillus caseinilyticus]UOQ47232.1 C40 family peptidase [Gracilibacillus caseinilyticus]